jgi:Ca2+-binding EF-hand superfamily protein
MSAITEDKIQKEFRRLDKNDDKSITIEELRKYYLPIQEMFGVPPPVAEQEIQGLLQRLDSNNDGKISFDGRKNILY